MASTFLLVRLRKFEVRRACERQHGLAVSEKHLKMIGLSPRTSTYRMADLDVTTLISPPRELGDWMKVRIFNMKSVDSILIFRTQLT